MNTYNIQHSKENANHILKIPQFIFIFRSDETAKSPDQKFWMDYKKDKIGNFERGCSQSNHRKDTDFGLLQDFKRMIMTFGSRVIIQLRTRRDGHFPLSHPMNGAEPGGSLRR